MTLMGRAVRGMREHLRSQFASVATVALALFCLAGAMLALENAGALSTRWGAPVRVTVYLADGATAEQIETLRGALAELPEVAEARYVSPGDTRASLTRADGDRTLANAPVELFPATIEMRLSATAIRADRVQSLAERVQRLPMVSDVETYRGLTDRMQRVLASGKLALFAIALVVLLCATAVVSNTVRLSLHARMREVEVMCMVGASPRYVKAPFLLEGAMLGGGGAFVALAGLAGAFYWLRGNYESAIAAIVGMRPLFLSWGVLIAFVAAGGLLGAMGSAVAMRRSLQV